MKSFSLIALSAFLLLATPLTSVAARRHHQPRHHGEQSESSSMQQTLERLQQLESRVENLLHTVDTNTTESFQSSNDESSFTDPESAWESFKIIHNRQYESKREEYYRRNIFMKRHEKASKHNKEHAKGKHGHKMPLVSQFSDLTQEEFEKQYLTPSSAFPAPHVHASPIIIFGEEVVASASIDEAEGSTSVQAVVPYACQSNNSNCCISSPNPLGCCNALGFSSWDRKWCQGPMGPSAGNSGSCQGSCQQQVDVDFPGRDIGQRRVNNANDCCTACQQTGNCHAWTLSAGVCYMKDGVSSSNSKPGQGLISGTVGCASGSSSSGGAVVPSGCQNTGDNASSTSCCGSSSNANGCCQAFGFNSWNGRTCSGTTSAVVPGGCNAGSSHCCSESVAPQLCCQQLGFGFYDGAFCRAGAAPALLPNGYPVNFDWTQVQGFSAVSGVKNQGGCGSCTFFASTGTMESAWAIKNSKSAPQVSEQQILDCAVPGNGQCWSSNFEQNLQYVFQQRHNIQTEAAYPYTAGSDTSSNPNACNQRRGQQNGAPFMFSGMETYNDGADLVNDDLVMRLVAKGPTAYATTANWMQSYHSGIYTGDCPPQVNHGVILVGWGTENGVQFWKLKNQWGAGWGEGGFGRFQRKPGQNQCFLYHEVTRSIA